MPPLVGQTCNFLMLIKTKSLHLFKFSADNILWYFNIFSKVYYQSIGICSCLISVFIWKFHFFWLSVRAVLHCWAHLVVHPWKSISVAESCKYLRERSWKQNWENLGQNIGRQVLEVLVRGKKNQVFFKTGYWTVEKGQNRKSLK